MSRRVSCICSLVFLAVSGLGLGVVAAESAPPPAAEKERLVRFNRDVRPILSDHCFQCHGPDSQSRQASLRLDQPDGLFEESDGAKVLVSGDSAASELWKRITHADADLRMPPADFKKPLSPAQIETLRLWIEQGAEWEDHWAFVTPERPDVPTVGSASDLAHHPIDSFVLSVLETQQLRPAEEASPETLLRRVTFDLTGLPPTVEELDAWLAETAPDRYERLVDRLLASPRYGEQMAVTWLDAARYADTSGYQSDGPRDMWRWRDWVIDAYNANMPFDQFTIEQLAGDLLPDVTLDQRVATGFNRNHRGNAEGGIVPEEYAVEYVADRVDTTGTVWLGLTIGCARCHDHKFDPITQRDYYRLFAYFNNIPEFGRAIKEGNSPPYLLSPTPGQQMQLDDLEARLAAARVHWQSLQPELEQALQSWKREGRETDPWTVGAGLSFRSLSGYDQENEQPIPSVLHPHSSPLKAIGAPAGDGRQFDGQGYLEFGDQAKFGYRDKFSVAAWVLPQGNMTGGVVTKMTDDSDSDGWALHLHGGKLQVNLSKRWLDDALRVETAAVLVPDRWQHITMTYDGSRTARGVEIYVDGVRQNKVIRLDLLNQTIVNNEPLRIGSTGTKAKFTGGISDVRIYERHLSDWEVQALATPQTVSEIMIIPADQRTPGQRVKLREAFLSEAASEEIRQSIATLRQLEAARAEFIETVPTTMIMHDMERSPRAPILDRGEYNRPGEMVGPGVPEVFVRGDLPEGTDRLALARWIVAPDHPLTARVAVNREWQRFFGTGLVKTSEDFGTQAEPPSHPELLDWLATEFVRSGWDVKRLQRLIVTSATYRQASAVGPEQYRRDPENRLLARGPRFRMSAEMIRDQALAVAGLLHESPGGPSFFPYQPEGLWKEIATDTKYERSQSPDLYRRTLYSYGKRTVSNPTLSVFDAPSREACLVRRSRTNTPLQALALLNDVTFVEAARKLAERSLKEHPMSEEARIGWMFRSVTGRVPTGQETTLLTEGLTWHRLRFRTDPAEATALLAAGDAAVDPSIPVVELAAHAALANVILNLDEAVTRE